MQKLLIYTTGLMIFLFTLVMPAYALTIPVFPSCTIPQGTVKAQFGQGTHGIVGSTDTFIGSDSVFTLTEDTLLQCFCPEIGTDGIQTNWWRATGLTDNDKLDFSKTETVMLASEKIRKNLYRQVYHVKFMEKAGNVIEAITVSDASREECSLGDVEVFVISQHLGVGQIKKPGIVQEKNKITNKKGSGK